MTPWTALQEGDRSLLGRDHHSTILTVLSKHASGRQAHAPCQTAIYDVSRRNPVRNPGFTGFRRQTFRSCWRSAPRCSAAELQSMTKMPWAGARAARAANSMEGVRQHLGFLVESPLLCRQHKAVRRNRTRHPGEANVIPSPKVSQVIILKTVAERTLQGFASSSLHPPGLAVQNLITARRGKKLQRLRM